MGQIMSMFFFIIFCASLYGQPSIVVDSPHAKESRTPKFSGLDSSFLDEHLKYDALIRYKRDIEIRNSPRSRLWTRRFWNLDYYKEKNLPVVAGELKNKQKFSEQYQGLGLRFLDLPLHMPGQGWRIPHELEQFKEVIKMAVDHERACMPDFEKNHFVYITVDQGLVQPHTSQRRGGYHGDSYRKINSKNGSVNILVDHVYVIYDNCPTLYKEGPFNMDTTNPESVSEVLAEFERGAAEQPTITFPPYTLLRMDPYCVHDAGVNAGDVPLYRTFVKISFSKVKYAHLGNAHNSLFIYDWPMTPRSTVPYTKEALATSAHRKDRDQFIEIDPEEVDFLHKKCAVKWAKSPVYTVYKKSCVTVKPARAGDMLESKQDDFLITINIAQEGDYKVAFADGDAGFMSSEKFHRTYSPDPHSKNKFTPKKTLRRAVQLIKDTRMKAPWGTMHYARAGGYLIYIDETDCYFIPKELFESTYEILP